jgi:hypothetical protein
MDDTYSGGKFGIAGFVSLELTDCIVCRSKLVVSSWKCNFLLTKASIYIGNRGCGCLSS